MIKIKAMPTNGQQDQPIEAPFGLDFYLDQTTYNVRLIIDSDGNKRIQVREIEGQPLTLQASSSNQIYIL